MTEIKTRYGKIDITDASQYNTGPSPFQSGVFYCPHVPLQIYTNPEPTEFDKYKGPLPTIKTYYPHNGRY